MAKRKAMLELEASTLQAGLRREFIALKETCRATGGRAVLMRNHAKVVAFAGEAWSGAVEGSANLANNSGCEQIVLTRDARLADFYFGTFDGIKSMGSEV